MHIAVAGLGKIGQPLAALFASLGHEVTGADVNPQVVAALNAGHATVINEPDLDRMVAETVAAGRLRATVETAEAVAAAAAVVITVPLVLDAQQRPDFQMLDAAFTAIAAGLQRDTLVLLETTVPVGATRRRFGPLLERSGLQLGREVFLAFSPERVQSGRVMRDLATYPKVIGGVDAESGRRAAAFYAAMLAAPVLQLSSAEAAEFCKLAESVYRDVNIGLANELALAAERHGLDIAEIIPAANSEPQSHLHAPGIGVGGHCMPVYPYFLLGDGGAYPIVAAGRERNEAMPAYVADLLERRLGALEGRQVLILGLAYRTGVKEAMHSPAAGLAALLRGRGARALVHDPLFSDAEIRALGLEPAPLATDADALVLQTYHAQYRDLDLSRYPNCRLVVDGRNVLDPARVRAAGKEYAGIGRGEARD